MYLRNRQSTFQSLSPFLPIKLPKYFASEWSYASYRLPAPTAHIALQSALRGGGVRGDGGKLQHKDSEGIVIPDDGEEIGAREQQEKCVVGWIEVPVRIPLPGGAKKEKVGGKGTKEVDYIEEMQYQLVALTYSGCWYRLSVPSSSSTASASTHSASTQSPSPVMSSVSPSSRSNPVSIPTHTRSSSGSTYHSPRSPPSALPSPRSPPSSTPPRPSPLSQTSTVGSSAASTATAGTARPRSSTPTGPHPAVATRKGKERERDVTFSTSPTGGPGSTSTRIRNDSYTSTNNAGDGSSGRGGSGNAAGDGSKSGSGGASGKTSRKCSVEEFRRFGRWDGWG